MSEKSARDHARGSSAVEPAAVVGGDVESEAKPFPCGLDAQFPPLPTGQAGAELLAFVLRVLRACDSFAGPGCDAVWWRTDAPEYAPVTFLVQCNDTFDWASADAEPLTPANIDDFERAIRDCREATRGKPSGPGLRTWGENGITVYAPTLFCARVRKMRPMRDAYPGGDDHAEVREMLDACGPDRGSRGEKGGTS